MSRPPRINETVASAEWEQEWLYRETEIPTFSKQTEEEIQSLSIKLDSTIAEKSIFATSSNSEFCSH
jgi:hypothetical protein